MLEHLPLLSLDLVAQARRCSLHDEQRGSGSELPRRAYQGFECLGRRGAAAAPRVVDERVEQDQVGGLSEHNAESRQDVDDSVAAAREVVVRNRT